MDPEFVNIIRKSHFQFDDLRNKLNSKVDDLRIKLNQTKAFDLRHHLENSKFMDAREPNQSNVENMTDDLPSQLQARG